MPSRWSRQETPGRRASPPLQRAICLVGLLSVAYMHTNQLFLSAQRRDRQSFTFELSPSRRELFSSSSETLTTARAWLFAGGGQGAGVHAALVEAAVRGGVVGGWVRLHGLAPVLHMPQRQLLRVQSHGHGRSLAGAIACPPFPPPPLPLLASVLREGSANQTRCSDDVHDSGAAEA